MMSPRGGLPTRRFALIPVTAFLLGVAFATPAIAAYSLVWSDEFFGTSLNTGNWTIDIGDGCPDLCGWGNNELQYYRPENVTVAGGNLILTAREQFFGGRPFTSGKVHTKNKQSFLYGRVEMRAKIPTGGGMWPAFWMLPEDDVYGTWAASGEIDIMESANETTSISGTIHYGGTWPDNTFSGGSTTLGGANFADEFHVYAVEWEPDEIRWYVDGTHYSTKTSAQWYSNGAPGNPRAPFDQNFYLILNTAVGGYFTECLNPVCVTADFPQEFLIDYVRVYQDTPNLAPTVLITDPNEGTNPPAGDITISASASDSDGTVAKVEFYSGTTYLGEDTAPPYAITWTSVADGCYAVTAKVYDNEGAYATDTADITVGTGSGQAPFPGSPFVLPTKIEAEDYDLGGEGVAYHDTSPGNVGGQYRTSEDVDVQTCSDFGGGFNIGWLIEGEWLEYTVHVPVAGEYLVDVRVASQFAGGEFHIEFNGTDVTGDVAVPVTGGWQTWTTVTANATLSSGTQVMRFVPTIEGFNLNSMDFQFTVTGADLASQAGGFALHPSYPNPFGRSTTIGFSVPQRSVVDLGIYDVSGRLVRRLTAGEVVEAGRHDVAWNGRNGAGDRVAAGVYLCRMRAGGFSETQRITLLK